MSSASGAGSSVLLAAAYLAAGAGGIARVARLTARVLVDEGVSLSTLSLLDDAPVSFGTARAYSARASRARFAARHFFETWRCARIVYDAIGVARARAFTRPGARRPYAVWMHGVELWRALPRARLAPLEGARLRLVNSHFTLRRFHEHHGDALAAHVCWLATEADEAPVRAHDFDGPPIVMILGRMDGADRYKGHAELIEAWPSVASAVPGARLRIIGGGGGVDAVRATAGASPAASSIEILGFVPENEMDEHWRAAHVLAMPSRKEGFGLVYAEAMRHGVPVLASVHDAGSEVNVDGETGLNVDLDRPGELADRLVGLLRDTNRAAQFGRAGQARWRTHFSYSAFRTRLAPVLSGFVGDE